MTKFFIAVLATLGAATVFTVSIPADAATAADWELPSATLSTVAAVQTH